MIVRRKFVTSLLVLALLFTEACNKKKPVLPPRTVAPTIAVELPDEIPENPETPAPEVVQAQVEPPPVKTKPKKAPKTATKKTTAPPASVPVAAPTSPAPPTNNQTVASLRPPRNAGTELPPDTAIAAVMPSQKVTEQKEKTAQIVDAAENSLKNLTRQLTDEEKAMKSQIQSYLQQSRKATTDGDFERAFNLANKAQLLADALVKK